MATNIRKFTWEQIPYKGDKPRIIVRFANNDDELKYHQSLTDLIVDLGKRGIDFNIAEVFYHRDVLDAII